MKRGRRGSAAIIILAVVVIAIIVGGAWYYFTRKPQIVQPSTGSNAQGDATSSGIAYKAFTWVDPTDSVYGFHFNVPSTWIEQPNGNERSLEIDSCNFSTSTGCNENGMIRLQIQVAPSGSPHPLSIPDYTKYGETILSSSTITIGGVPGQAVVGLFPPLSAGPNLQASSSISAWLYFMKDNVQYLATLSGNQSFEDQMKTIGAEMISSFAFVAPQAQQPPAEYQLLKGFADWSNITYQDQNTTGLACSDGNTGTMPQGYVFTMIAYPSDGDITTPYKEIVSALESNGWTQCNDNAMTHGPNSWTVFLKGSRLIQVEQSASTGVGNAIAVKIQY